MRREVNISPESLIEDSQVQKVVNTEEAKETAKVSAGTIVFVSTCLLSAVIILASCTDLFNKKDTNTNNAKNINNEVNVEAEAINYADENNTQESTDSISEDNIVETNQDEQNEINITIRDVDYSNVEAFYNHIIENRNKYGSFAESFQTQDDIKNFINFLYKFDQLYGGADTYSTIDSQEMYDRIIQDYYNSCVTHDVKGELNLLYSHNKLAQDKIAEAENLTYDLKNGKGNDYTIANRYYTFILENFIDGRTMVDINQNNAPFIDALREQYEYYRHSEHLQQYLNTGNMLNARKYQKNDSLPVDSIHIYYADEAPEGVEVTEIENSLTCPDWGVDNIFSKYEEDTETKLYIKRDNQGVYEKVDEAFTNVLNKGKVR